MSTERGVNCEMNHDIQRLPLDPLDLLTCSLNIHKDYSAQGQSDVGGACTRSIRHRNLSEKWLS